MNIPPASDGGGLSITDHLIAAEVNALEEAALDAVLAKAIEAETITLNNKGTFKYTSSGAVISSPGSKPSPSLVGAISNSLITKDGTIASIVEEHLAGHTISFNFDDLPRSTNNFKSSKFIIPDIDDAVDMSSASDVLTMAEAAGIKDNVFAIIPSASDSPEKRKFHIVIELDVEVNNPIQFRVLFSQISVGVFGGDISSKDAARIFFGNAGISPEYYNAGAVPLSVADWSAGWKDLVAEPAPQKELNVAERDSITNALLGLSAHRWDDYSMWVTIGMALKYSYGDDAFEIYDEMSQNSPKYPGRDAVIKKWLSFSSANQITNPTTVSTIYGWDKHDNPTEVAGIEINSVNNSLPYLHDLPFDDAGNADAVVACFPDTFAFNKAVGWMIYAGGCWKSEKGSAELKVAIEVALRKKRQDIAEFREFEEDAQRNAALRTAKASSTNVRNAIFLLQAATRYFVSFSEFNNPKVIRNFLNVKNGVVDLRTGQLLDHDPKYYFTEVADTDYLPDVDMTQWRQLLQQFIVPYTETDEDRLKKYQEIVDFIQVFVGYGATADTREDRLLYIWGPTRAGKNVFSEAIHAALGSVAASVSYDLFTRHRHNDANNFDLATLSGKRFISASESGKRSRVNSQFLKMITGGTPVRCAFKHQDNFEYTPAFKIAVFSNYEINADAQDDAFWQRCLPMEFPNSHVGKEDTSLRTKVKGREYREQVLSWIVAGSIKWYTEGLKIPALIEYNRDLQQASNDHFNQFYEEMRFERTDVNTESLRQDYVRTLYQSWFKENNTFGELMTNKEILGAFQRKGFSVRAVRNGNSVKKCFQFLRRSSIIIMN